MHWHNGPKTSWRGRMNFSKSLPLDLPPSFFKSYTPENSHTTQKMTLWTFPTSKRGDVFFSSMLQVVFWEVFQYGGFLKWWYPTTMGFPTKNDHFGVFWGYPYFWKYPYIHSPVSPQLLQLGPTSKTRSSAKVQAAFAKCRGVNSTESDLETSWDDSPAHPETRAELSKMPRFWKPPWFFHEAFLQRCTQPWKAFFGISPKIIQIYPNPSNGTCSSFALQQWDHFCRHWNADSWSPFGSWYDIGFSMGTPSSYTCQATVFSSPMIRDLFPV